MELNATAMADARTLHARLTKPPGSLGFLEDVGVQLAGIAAACPPPLPEPAAIAVFAADHGVATAGVTPWPQEVTAQMVANICAGGAAVNALARQVGARLLVVDVGVAAESASHPALVVRKVAAGTADLSIGPAMTTTQARVAFDVGGEIADRLVRDGARLLGTGEMGIGNTTPAAALVAAFTGRDPVDCTGRGTGIDDRMLVRKRRIVSDAVARVRGTDDPWQVLAEVGGLEIAALAGYVVAGAAARVPVVVDGVIALAGVLTAEAIAPGVVRTCVAGHRSTEPGATAALEHLGLRPLLDLDLRLGEGTGACLAVPLVQAAARVLREMATFDGAGVTEK